MCRFTPVEVKELAGVRMPSRGVRVFDCRWDDSSAWCGKFVSEKVAPLVGVSTIYALPQPWGIEGVCLDTTQERLADYMRDLRNRVARHWREYRKAKRDRRRDRGHGGSVHNAPGFITLANYGYSMHSFHETAVIVYF
jgi:hypothetical protein